MLTEQQIKHFDTWGFLIFRQVFSQDELKTIHKEFEAAMEAAYQHAPFDGTHRHWLPMLGPETPFFANLPEDPRFSGVAEQLYGDDVFFCISDANRYVGNTGWHPDHNVDPTKDCYGVKFAYYLEPVDAETGALRLIPGSHKNPLHNDLRENLNELSLEICDVPGYVCKSEPGDVVAFDMRCWHASWGGSDDRRMCTVVYYNNPKTPVEDAATRERARSNAKSPEHFNRPGASLYDPHWIANSEGSEKRQRWIDRLDELGFLDPAQA